MKLRHDDSDHVVNEDDTKTAGPSTEEVVRRIREMSMVSQVKE